MKTRSNTAATILRSLVFASLASLATLSPAAVAQKIFPTPEAAADTLVDAVARSDAAALRAVLGTDYAKRIPDASEDEITAFLANWAKRHGVIRRNDSTAFLEVGETRWQLPIPIVESAAGWSFDTRGAEDEMRTRRIGRNELAVIKVSLAYADAQDEYFQADPDRDGVKAYATKLISSKGRHDGLYWPTLDDEPPSPLGPIMALVTPGQPYHGYLYRILTAQGAAAPGGAKDYIRDGRMTEGFALVAWPAKYGDSGVMTFIVNRDGVVHEKDLGLKTDAIARALKAYDPDPGWKKSDLPAD